ncbi:hypothetical protein GO730_37890 [Spirosoma sp. HMF3257]|uniref:Uncharacterized protein n=1 Tax=Spirosoma telluris TaxID=2183553 RepID=A0A327NDW3_9BACT|nr:hypothetical protein [Spirosoma telluris]RAI73145.1 hypothetical protein HMF3257_37795 [Spirosoma telluris]
MRAYLIDPSTRTISLVDTDGELLSIYALLDCQLVTTAAGQPNGDILFVDDDVSESEHDAFSFEGWTIYSKALVLGTDEEGESTTPQTLIHIFEDQISWLGKKVFDPNVAFLSWETSNLIWVGLFPN